MDETKRIRIAVCDDSEADRQQIVLHCRAISEKHAIDIEIKVYTGGHDILFDFENPQFYNTVDIIFLDIHMPGINGIDTARQLREYGYRGLIIFITISKAFYENAFDVNAFNYITKDDNGHLRFEAVFLRAVKAARTLRQDVLVLSGGGELRQIAVGDIEYIDVIKRVMSVYYGGQRFEFISTLDKLENQLFGKGFVRIHRHYLVSLAYVKQISYEEVTMHNGARLAVGRKYYPALKAAVERLKSTVIQHARTAS